MPDRTILLIEDNEDDIFFMQRALKQTGVKGSLNVVEDGEEAIAYLTGTGNYQDREEFPLPCIVLLDLKLPRKNGLEVLEWIREQEEFARMVVIVFTSSRHAKDIAAAARLGANSFLVKPPNVDELSNVMAVVRNYWLDRDQFVAGY